MIIDAPRKKDLPDLKAIWQEAFGDSPEFLRGFFRKGFSPERCRCLFWEDRPVAVLYWFDCFFQGKKLAYFYAVATEKACRGRGFCRMLMQDTHNHLKTLGYSAATLVPENNELFSMYENMGYLPFCPMKHVGILAGDPSVPVEEISVTEYFSLRKKYLPENAILQDSAAPYLNTFTDCYRTENGIACLSQRYTTLEFQEYLGDPKDLPGILTALDAKNAVLLQPGGDPYAMYLPFDDTDLKNTYLGISLG